MRVLYSSLFFLITINCLGQKVSFSLGGNLTSGNLISYGVNLRSTISSNEDKLNQFNFSPSYDYGELVNNKGDRQITRKEVLSIFNYSRDHGRVKFYVYNEIENSLLRQIKLRGSLGTGVSFRFIRTEQTNFDISQFILPEIFESSFNTSRNNKALRLSTRIRYSNNWSKQKFSTQLLFQPSVLTIMGNGDKISWINNTNMRFTSSYELGLNKNLSVGLMSELIIQTITTYINPIRKPYDLNTNLFIRGSF